uniref:Uncharacterized protein n=2 Tax=Lutzomyia longipalpis TaxID=7200 RepID=A0A1B0CBR3_LUTLO
MTRNDEPLSSEYESDELMDCSDEGASIEAPLLSANFPPSGIPSDSEKNQQEQTKGASNASAMEKPEISAEDLISELSQENLIDYNSRMMFEYFPDDTSSPLPQYSEDSEDYDEEMEKFAVFLNYYAPRGYDYAEKKYGVVPPKAIVAGWYVTNDFMPGFSKESFEAIAAEQKSSPTQVFVHILFDELRVEHDKMACDELEYINFGQGSLDDDMCVVKRVFVFIASSVTKRWKIPLGFLACDEMGSDKEIVANLIEICTILLLKTGVKVTGVTMPLDENIPAFTALGCKFQYPHAKSNFSLLDQEMVFFPDPADVLEIIRFSFQHYGPFIDGDGNEIEWMYLDNLLKLHEKEGAELCKKTRAAQMYLTRKKIQTKLSVYTMHKSVADALEYFEDKLKLPEFKGACATANFVRIIAQSMELLNGRWNGQKIFSSENSMAIQAFIITVCTYIRSMRLRKGVRLLKSHQNTGFIGLVFALRSLPIIYVNAVHEHGLPFIRLDSFTKDPLELLFSICRSNTYFVRIRKFYNNYKDLSVHWQRKDMKSGEIVPADWLSALHAQTTKAAKAINYSDRYFKFSTRCVELPAEESPTNDFWDNFEALFRLPKASEYRKNVMRYIGGFIGHLLRNKLKCLDCGSALTGSYHGYRIMWQKKLQIIKYPNKAIEEICWLTERMINTYGFDAEKKSKRISMLVE